MSKKEFLEKLREYLSFELPERLVQKNIRYYSNYFDEQEKLGKNAAAVSEELGDPQLIARSCIDAEKSGADGIPNSADDVDFSEEIEREKARGAGGVRGSFGEEDPSRKEADRTAMNRRRVSVTGCLLFLLLIAVIVGLVISFLFSRVGLIFLSVLGVSALIGWAVKKLLR